MKALPFRLPGCRERNERVRRAPSFSNSAVVTVTNRRGSAELPSYGSTQYSYDATGRVTNYWDPLQLGTSAWQSTYPYDSAGDIASWTHPMGWGSP